MRVRRTVLVDSARDQYFHVVSRIVNRDRLMGDLEKDYLMKLAKAHAAFTGVEILSACIMSNHFHLLIRVPSRPAEITEKEIWGRMKHIYGVQKINDFKVHLNELKEKGHELAIKAFWDGMRRRMYDLSEYVKEVKQRFSSWYNGLHDRKGTLWEERFRSLLVEGERGALMAVAAYIALNPIRAGLVKDPKDYRWSTYSEAVAGGKLARKGIIAALGINGMRVTWNEAQAQFRLYVYCRGVETDEKAGFTSEEIHQERVRQGRLGFADILESRIRHFTDGLVIGSQMFINDFYRERQNKLNSGRQCVAHQVGPSEGLGLYSYRNLIKDTGGF